VNRLYDLLEVVFEGHDVLGLTNNLAEARVNGAFLLPDILVRPPVDHLEPLHKEDAQVFRLVVGTAVNCRDDSLHYLSENVEDINLGHSELNQKFDKID